MGRVGAAVRARRPDHLRPGDQAGDRARGRGGARRLGRQGIESYEFFEFVSVNTVVSIGPDGTARGRLYTIEPGQLETGEWNTAFGVYDDDYALVDGRWRFAKRYYRTLARKREGARAEVFPYRPDEV